MLAHLYRIIFLPTGQTSDSVFACECVWAFCRRACWFIVFPLHSAVCFFFIITVIHCSFKVYCVCACYMCLLVTAARFLLYNPWAKATDSPSYSRILALSAFASGTGQAFGASLPGLCFHLIILTTLTLPSEWGEEWGVKGWVFAKVKWWLLMLSPLNTCLVLTKCM